MANTDNQKLEPLPDIGFEIENEALASSSTDEALSWAEAEASALGRYIESLYSSFSSSSSFEKAKSLAKESRNFYNVELEPTNFPWPNASNIRLPFTRIAVDELEPRLVSSIIGQSPIVSVRGLPNPQFGLDELQMRLFGKQVEELFDYLLKNEVRIERWMPSLVHNLLLDGNAYVLLDWTVETRLVRENQEERLKPVFEGVRAEVIPLEHVYLADDVDDGSDWESRPILVYRGGYTLSDLEKQAMVQDGWVVTPEELKNEITDYLEPMEGTESVGQYDALPDYLKPIELIMAFVKWRLMPDEPESDLIVWVSKKSWRVLRVIRQIDYIDANVRPLRRLRLFPQQNTTWSKPLYHTCKGLQLCADALWNRCVNSADIAITPWFLYELGMSYETIGDLMISPGKGIGLPSTDGIVFPNLGQFNPVNFVPLLSQIVGFWERTFNVSDYMQGRESALLGKKGSTATGTLAILQEGKIKHEYRGTLLRYQLEDLMSVIFDLYRTRLTVEKTAMILGDPVPVEMLSAPYTLTMQLSDSTVNRFIRRQELESFMTGAQPLWQLFNPQFFAELYSREYQFDPKETIDPELNQLIQQYLFVKSEGRKLAAATGMDEQQARNVIAQHGMPAEELIKQIQQKQGPV